MSLFWTACPACQNRGGPSQYRNKQQKYEIIIIKVCSVSSATYSKIELSPKLCMHVTHISCVFPRSAFDACKHYECNLRCRWTIASFASLSACPSADRQTRRVAFRCVWCLAGRHMLQQSGCRRQFVCISYFSPACVCCVLTPFCALGWCN